jgi:hypothetical protein
LPARSVKRKSRVYFLPSPTEKPGAAAAAAGGGAEGVGRPSAAFSQSLSDTLDATFVCATPSAQICGGCQRLALKTGTRHHTSTQMGMISISLDNMTSHIQQLINIRSDPISKCEILANRLDIKDTPDTQQLYCAGVYSCISLRCSFSYPPNPQ